MRTAEHIECEGEAMYTHVEKMKLEGIVAKRASSIYVRGRCKDWLKIKTPIGKARELKRMEQRFR